MSDQQSKFSMKKLIMYYRGKLIDNWYTFIQNLVLQSQKRFLTPVGQPLNETRRGTGAWNSSLGQELMNCALNDFGLLSFND